MTYYGGKELAAAFRTVRKNTVQIAEDIPENQYGFRASPDTRTIGQMLAHIAFAPSFQLDIHQNRIDNLGKVNFPALFQRLNAEEHKPRTKAEIIALLKSEGETFAKYIETLQDSFLAEPVAPTPGTGLPTRTRFEMLLGAKEHEMHHRAQLMLLERMIGVVPHLTRQMQARMAQAQAAAPQRT